MIKIVRFYFEAFALASPLDEHYLRFSILQSYINYNGNTNVIGKIPEKDLNSFTIPENANARMEFIDLARSIEKDHELMQTI